MFGGFETRIARQRGSVNVVDAVETRLHFLSIDILPQFSGENNEGFSEGQDQESRC